ncbi:hypothetical protein BC830DRAFT_1169372 [Chytriomyces sp. MP71]|nr:hypothetical protein BC830DRAFT_1169372 [Chytriomyces sp. MP71]
MLALVAKTLANPSICDSSNTVCVTFLAGSEVTLLLESTQPGWVGLGFGTSMANAKSFYIGWGTGLSSKISQRDASYGELLPPPAASPQVTLSMNLSQFSVQASSKTSVVFTVPRSLFNANGATDFIFASCSQQPSNANDIPQHDGPHGTLSYDISTGAAALTTVIPSAWIAHGACLFVAWGCIPYIIIFIARYLKFRLGHAWFIAHAVGGGIGTLGLTVAGVCIMAINGGVGFKVNGNPHIVLGAVIVYGILPAQILLGILADRLFKPDRAAVPWWDQAHWWVGRASLVLSAAAIHLGINQAGISWGWIVAFWVWIGVMVVAIVAGQIVLGTSTHAGEPPVNKEEDLQIPVAMSDRSPAVTVSDSPYVTVK